MAVNGLLDVVTAVTVPKPEYEELVRDSNTLDILKDYISTSRYPSIETVGCILGIKKEREENE